MEGTAKYGSARCTFYPITTGAHAGSVWIALHEDPGYGPMGFSSQVCHLSEIEGDADTLRWVADRMVAGSGTENRGHWTEIAEDLRARADAL